MAVSLSVVNGVGGWGWSSSIKAWRKGMHCFAVKKTALSSVSDAEETTTLNN